MRAWYDIRSAEIAPRRMKPASARRSRELDELIAREAERGIPTGRVLLAGFSQGGAIVLAGGMRHASKLAGIIALSTYLPIAEKTDAERSAANRATPIFMAHGDSIRSSRSSSAS